jgi:hypothetical protein
MVADRLIKSKVLRRIIFAIILLYALAGFFLITVFIAVKLHLTNDPGAVDFNDRYFTDFRKDKTEESVTQGSKTASEEVLILNRIAVLQQFHPSNAREVLNTYVQTGDVALAGKMLDALDLYLGANQKYQDRIRETSQIFLGDQVSAQDSNLFTWVNTQEWSVLREAVRKDKARIDSVAVVTGVSARLMTAMLIGEQIRLFDSKREAFKKWIQPLKILVNETTLSLGVMGIKEETAIKIENGLTNKSSIYYLGPEAEHLLDFKTADHTTERFQRLTNPRDHTWPYMYCAVYLKQVMQQWNRSGYDISDKPEILATLFNLGFEVSKPKPNPKVGGSRIKVDGIEYTFGRLAFEYYYSGELSKEFPL